jgi:hypothetical protein
MGIHAYSRRGVVDAEVLERANCARHGIQLLVAAFVLYLLAAVASTHMTQLSMLTGVIWANMTQASPVVIVQVLQALAAVSAIASTIQTFLGAKPAVTNFAKSAVADFAKPTLTYFAKPAAAEFAKPAAAEFAKPAAAEFAKPAAAEFAKPAAAEFAKPVAAELAKPAVTYFAKPHAYMRHVPTLVAENGEDSQTLASTFVKNPWSLSISGSRNILVIPMDGLRNVLIIFVCGILIGGLSPRIGETVMFLLSLRGAVDSIYSRIVGGSATGCNTNKLDETESSENYMLRDICD